MKKRIVSMPPPKRQLIELETTSHSTPRRSFARIPSLREIPLENNSIVPLEIENIGIPMVMTRRPTMRAYKKKPEVEQQPIKRKQSTRDLSGFRDTANVFIQAMNSNLKMPEIEEEKGSIGLGVPLQPPVKVNPSPILDYSDIFTESIGKSPGLLVFRIENFIPIERPTDEIGYFCVADAYIILETTYVKDQFEFAIYTWIGQDSETDKKFCCAMYAVALRNQLKATCRISRQNQDEESDEFLRLFPRFEVLDHSFGTETGLFMASERKYQLKLYKVEGKNSVMLVRVCCSCDVLQSENVYLLDAGMKLYQWNGNKSTLQHRTKGRMILNRINHAERVGKAEIIELDQGNEPLEFLERLDTENDFIDSFSPLTLYHATGFVANQPLDQLVIAKKRLKKQLLRTNECFVVDHGTELFLWIGKDSTKQSRRIGNELFAMVVQSRLRPLWVSLNRIVQDAETEVFKLLFTDWEVSSVKRKPSENKDVVKIDVDDLYNLSSRIACDVGLIEDTMQKANSCLEAFTTFVFHKGKFVMVPDSERGHYHMYDAYVFLCVYKAPPKLLDQLIRHEIKDITVPLILDTEFDEEPVLECVVYFCQTTKTSKLAFSTFTMQTQTEMKQLVDDMYNCKLSVQKVEFGNEPFALLAHLENNFVLHRNSRRDGQDHVALFQIRTDHRYATTRAYQIPFDTEYLSSIDSYFVMDVEKEEHILWKGENVKSYGFEACIDLVNMILQQHVPAEEQDIEMDIEDVSSLPLSVRVCENETEIPEFFEYLTKPQHIKQYFVNPHVFICNCSQGYFKVTKIDYITQEELTSESCVMIDPGAPDPVHVWVGGQTPESVQKMTRECVKIWLQTCQDQRTVSAPKSQTSLEFFSKPRLSEIKEFAVYERQGEESKRFKSFFQAWDEQYLKALDVGNEFSRSQQQTSPMLFPTM